MIYKKKQHTQYNSILFWIVGLIICNVLSQYFFFRIDLTQDNRHSLHQSTKDVLKNIQKPLHVTIYLAGDLPLGPQKLQYATQSLLSELAIHTKKKLFYTFVNIDDFPVEKRKSILKKLIKQGIQPTNLYIEQKGKRIEKLILPGAVINYQEKEIAVMLLKSNRLLPPAQILHQSIENLEYELAMAIRTLTTPNRKKVALLRGHDEPDMLQLSGLQDAIKKYYDVLCVDFSDCSLLEKCDAWVITKPKKCFSEEEKYQLDQYIMHGGKVLFFLDRLHIEIDSLWRGYNFAFSLDVGLDDLLFKYGVRINHDLIQDLNAGVYPIIVGNLGNQPQVNLIPFPFFPILNHFSPHLITKNLDAIYAEFISSIDTVQAKGIKKIPLVYTSPYTKKCGTPVQVHLEDLRKEPNRAYYNQGKLPVAYLLEGCFESLYKNRFLPKGINKEYFLNRSTKTKLLVVSSGNSILNSIHPKNKQPIPLGYDPFLKHTFAQGDFFCNALSYMLEEQGLINAKNKNFSIRLLDNIKVKDHKLRWKIINIGIPLLLLIFLGIIWSSIHRNYYAKVKKPK